MADMSKNEYDSRVIQRIAQHVQGATSESAHSTLPISGLSPFSSAGQKLGHSANAAIRADAFSSAQRTYGNRAVQRSLQRMAAPPAIDSTQGEDMSERIAANSGNGEQLDEGVRARLEEGLAADLSAVRVHTDNEADKLARAVESMAFTTGQDIFFSSGSYNPHSTEGLRLLAHEATHTVQQSQGPVDGTPSEGGVSVSDPLDRFEREAEHAAESVMAGKREKVGREQPSTGQSGNPSTSQHAVQRAGKQPPKAAPDWYYYGNENKTGGLDFGAGWGAEASDEGSLADRLGMNLGPFVSGNVGSWGKEKFADERIGMKLTGGLGGKAEYKGNGWGADIGLATGNAEASVGTDGFTFGATGNLAEASGTLGSFGKAERSTDGDQSVRAGFSGGFGLQLRGHWGDADGDKRPEYGYGFDAGPLSYDFKTESPHRLLLGPVLGPLLGAAENKLGLRNLGVPGPEDLPPTPDPMDAGVPNNQSSTQGGDTGASNPAPQMIQASPDALMDAGRSAVDWLTNL